MMDRQHLREINDIVSENQALKAECQELRGRYEEQGLKQAMHEHTTMVNSCDNQENYWRPPHRQKKKDAEVLSFMVACYPTSFFDTNPLPQEEGFLSSQRKTKSSRSTRRQKSNPFKPYRSNQVWLNTFVLIFFVLLAVFVY